MDGLLIALFVILAYVILVYVLKGMGILEKFNMTNWGPFIMWRTGRGRNLLDWLARPRRFWQAYAFAGKVAVIVTMVSMLALLLWEATIVPSIPAESAPTPDMMLGIPGINPIIPVWYGILGLVIAVFVHEFAHGILARVGDMKVKAMGIVWMVIPMGAFVEPDEDELGKTTKKKRTSVYAVGPATNIFLALLCAFLFSSVMVASAEPANGGPVVISVGNGSPADLAEIPFGAQVIEINGVPVTMDNFGSISTAEPGDPVTIVYTVSGERHEATVTAGMAITTIISGLPAEQAGLRVGMLIESIDGTTIHNDAEFRAALEAATPGATVPLTALQRNADGVYERVAMEITPLNKKDYYAGQGQDAEEMAFIGVNYAFIGVSVNTPQVILDRLAHPYAGKEGISGIVSGTLSYIVLPFSGLQPLSSPLTDLFVPGGIFAWMPNDLFWILANSMYWIFWINLMLGMTNALPAVPLDGGFLFKDWLDTIVAKVRKGADQKRRDAVVNSITWSMAILVLFLIVWQLVGPRIF